MGVGHAGLSEIRGVSSSRLWEKAATRTRSTRDRTRSKMRNEEKSKISRMPAQPRRRAASLSYGKRVDKVAEVRCLQGNVGSTRDKACRRRRDERKERIVKRGGDRRKDGG